MSVSTIAMDSAFVLVYPYGFDLRGRALRALDEAGIPHRAARFPVLRPTKRCRSRWST